MRIIPTATLAALIVSMPALAQNSSQTATATTTAAAQSPKPAAEEKKVCKLLETTGTRRSERVCLTKEEWKKVEEEVAH
jgi:hypothetical protein